MYRLSLTVRTHAYICETQHHQFLKNESYMMYLIRLHCNDLKKSEMQSNC